MNRFVPIVVLIALWLGAGNFAQSQQLTIDRQPAVAGQFYPSGKSELYSMLVGLFSKAVPSKGIPNVLAIICPHAGYVFSGDVAASCYNQIDPSKKYDNIFILGPSHYVGFDGGSIYDSGNFVTPLGTVEVNTRLAKELIAKYPFFTDRSDAHLHEHSIEVQLPFLQHILKTPFRIVPIVLGTQDPQTCAKIGNALRQYFNSNNLFVISSDFSHYPNYDDAARADKATADAILSNSSEKFLETLQQNESKGIPNLQTSACGWAGILTLLCITESTSAFEFQAITNKNSGDSQYGDKSRVVGYYSIVVSRAQAKSDHTFLLSDHDKSRLLAIARKTLEVYVQSGHFPEVDTAGFPAALKQPCGAFVTLRKHDDLRGCIGQFEPKSPLYRIVQQMTAAAAMRDPRFTAVEPDEVDKLNIEISVLTPLKRISSINEFQLGRDGIYLRKQGHTGTFLPEVATETGWTKEEFLGHCAEDKAGIGWDGWKDAELYTYQAIVFRED